MILQPIVENAIRHGIGRVPGPGRVEIAAMSEGGVLVLEVTNGGDPDDRGGSALSGMGIGLANTRARLEELYGSRQEARLEPLADGGARLQVRLPMEGSRASAAEGLTR